MGVNRIIMKLCVHVIGGKTMHHPIRCNPHDSKFVCRNNPDLMKEPSDDLIFCVTWHHIHERVPVKLTSFICLVPNKRAVSFPYFQLSVNYCMWYMVQFIVIDNLIVETDRPKCFYAEYFQHSLTVFGAHNLTGCPEHKGILVIIEIIS